MNGLYHLGTAMIRIWSQEMGRKVQSNVKLSQNNYQP